MVECVGCGEPIKAGQGAYSFCCPEGFACMCATCAARHESTEAVFRRLKDVVSEESSRREVDAWDRPYFAAAG